MGIQHDFAVVESVGHCFLCLNEIPCPITDHPINLEPSSDSSSASIYSLQSLSRYLKMDLREALTEAPQYLLTLVRESKLKVELCKDCARINDNFTEFYRQLEIIEMKVTSSLNLLYEKLMNSESTAPAMTKKLRQLAELRTDSSRWTGKLDILEVLRTEAIHTCGQKLNTAPPRVNLKNMTIEEINNIKLGFERESSSDCGTYSLPGYCSEESLDLEKLGIGNIKVEEEENPSMAAPDVINYDFGDSGNADQKTDAKVTVTSVTIIQDAPSSRNVDLKRKRKQKEVEDKLPYVKIPPSVSPSLEKSNYSLNPDTGKYKCSHCSRDFTRPENVHAHYKNVHLKVRYKCKLCEKEFASSSACSRHVQSVHVGVRFQCQFCGKRFKHKHHLTDHQRTICGAKMIPGPSSPPCAENI